MFSITLYQSKKNDYYNCALNWKSAALGFLFSLFIFAPAYSQSSDAYDEIYVILTVQRVGSTEVPAVIQNESAYLSVKEVFDFLKIKNNANDNFDVVEGYFISPQATYLVNKIKNQIVYQNKIYSLNAGDLIATENNLYLKSNYFGEIFGLDCIFNFRSLSINLNTKLELPIIREMQQEVMRSNINVLKGETKADTTIRRKFSLLHLGVLDWTVVTGQEKNSGTNTRISLSIGAIVAGGEASAHLDYNYNQYIKLWQQYYRWRHVNNDNAALRQISVGQIFTTSTASIFFPANGVQFTNTPTTYRRSFGTYRLSNTTEPGWIVELYVNGVLINYVKADASGFFTFEVPLVYGNSDVKLRFYGPWGEERVQQQNIIIPFNFLPAHKFEYNLTAAIISDVDKSRFSRASFNYGLDSRITIGGGTEYLSSVTSGKNMPFVNASVRIGAKMIIAAEHNYGVRTKGVISFNLPHNLQFDANYIKYKKGQTAIINRFDDERKIILSFPMRRKKIVAFSRFSLYQSTFSKFKFTTADFLLSVAVAGISTNLTNTAVYANSARPMISSDLSLTFRLPKGFRVTPQAQYQYQPKSFNMLRCEIEKNISSNGFLNVAYENNSITKSGYTTLGLRYNFSFAQIGSSARYGNNSLATVQAVRGSLLYNESGKKFVLNNQNNVGRGGLIISPYLDINCNGKKDKTEPKVLGLKIAVNGGRVEDNVKDTTIQVSGLEAYTNYLIKIDKNNFENIAWKIKHQNMSVLIEPNYLNVIEIPVAVVGEVSGMVYLAASGQSKKGQGRIVINFYDQNSKLVAHTIAESDGYFNFLGLTPGAYTAKIEGRQLLNLKMVSSPSSIAFNIKANSEGDVVEGLEFNLKTLEK
jgi:hypothetical protein